MKLTVPLNDGTILVFEGEYDELIHVAEKFVDNHGSTSSLSDKTLSTKATVPEKPPGHHGWTEKSARQLWRRLYGEQAKLIRYLLAHGGRATYDQLAAHLGYRAQQLSGILSPLTRNARTVTGNRLTRIIDWRMTDDGTREYFMDPNVMPLLERLTSQQ